jgi:hypothetical protein
VVPCVPALGLIVGAIHRDPRYVKLGAIVRAYAKADANAVCWRCGRTLPEHPPHKNGSPPHWQAGHTVDGSTTWEPWVHVTRTPHPALTGPGGWLAPEASTCNTSAGATTGNARRASGYDWP